MIPSANIRIFWEIMIVIIVENGRNAAVGGYFLSILLFVVKSFVKFLQFCEKALSLWLQKLLNRRMFFDNLCPPSAQGGCGAAFLT